MRKTLVFSSIFFVLALIFAPLTRAIPLSTETFVTVTPALTVGPTEDVIQPTITPEISEEPTVVGEINEPKEEEQKLDQKEIIGVILIGILILIIVIQSLWDKIKKPPTATSSDPE